MFELSSSDFQALTALARDLIRIPSLPGEERRVAELLADAMRQNEFAQVWTDRTGNVIGRFGAGRGPQLLYDGHMDTVAVAEPGAWTHDPFGGEIDRGILYGRGAADMKSALAAMVFGVKLLARSGVKLGGELIVAFVVQEEPSEGMAVAALLEEAGFSPSAVVLGEPTNLGLYVGQRGRVELEVKTYGRAGHASMPESGINAIAGAARVVFGIELLRPQLRSDPVLGQGSVTATQITSHAASLNSIPERCDLILDRRLTLGDTEARAIAEIQQVIRREGVRAEVHILEYAMATYTGRVLRGRKYYPPWLLPDDAPLRHKAAHALERALGTAPKIGVWAFSTDGAYTMGAAGIPTIGFGPGEERHIHVTDEQVRLADVALAARSYAQLAAELLPHTQV